MFEQLAGMNQQAIVIVALVAGATVLIIFAIAAVLNAPRARMKKRIAGVVGHGGAVIAADPGTGGQAKKLQGSKRKVAEKLKDAEAEGKKRRGAVLQQALTHAGLTMRPKKFIIMSLIGGALLTAAVWALGVNPVFMLAAAPIGVFGIPKLVLGFLVKRRLNKFTAYFADAIDVIVRGVRSGLTVGECLSIVSREIPAPVGPEFALVNEGIRLGMTTGEVLQRLSDRVPTPEVRFFTIDHYFCRSCTCVVV